MLRVASVLHLVLHTLRYVGLRMHTRWAVTTTELLVAHLLSLALELRLHVRWSAWLTGR